MIFFAFIHLVNIQGMGRCSHSIATVNRQVPESAHESDTSQPHGHVAPWYCSERHSLIFFGKLGKPNVNGAGPVIAETQLAC